MKQYRLFDIFSAVLKRKKDNGPFAEFSEAVQARIKQSMRNGNHLTIVFLNRDRRWDYSYELANYFAQRITLILSKACIRRWIICLPVEKENILLFETDPEVAESVLAEIAESLRHEGIVLAYKIRSLI